MPSCPRTAASTEGTTPCRAGSCRVSGRTADRRHVPRRIAVPCGEAPEQEDGRVCEQHVPCQRYREGERRDDEEVEAHHDCHGNKRHPFVRREKKGQRRQDLHDAARHVCHERSEMGWAEGGWGGEA